MRRSILQRLLALTSNVYTHLKLEDAQREMERLERIEKEMKKCAK